MKVGPALPPATGPNPVSASVTEPTRAEQPTAASIGGELHLMSMPAVAGAYALLADGATVWIRPAGPGDLDAVRQMHEGMSQDNSYLRFFSLGRAVAGQEAHRVCRPSSAEHVALLAWLDAELVGVASCEQAGQPDVAEIAFAVADWVHGRGVAMLLLEHLVSAARGRGVRTFTAQTLTENSAMLRVFADTGLHPRRQLVDGVIELTFDLPRGEADVGWERYQEAVASRESHADVASLRHVLAAESVVVVGAGRRPGPRAVAILRNIISGGYQGRLFAVSSAAGHVEGAQCLRTVAELPEPVDLAIVAVRPGEVADVAEECGRRGVKALVVVTSGVDAATGALLLATCRRHGMRLVGPGCLGIAVPGIHLDATLAASHPVPGPAGLAVQSGKAAAVLLERFCHLGVGVSSFASLGDKYDVSGNDLLMWWEQDAATKVAVLCLESYGNPRKFARTARRVGSAIPVLTLHAEQLVAGQHGDGSRTALAATPVVTREALFAQAGIIVARDTDELLGSTAMLAGQPVPSGSRIAIVSNDGNAGALAADACTGSGLQVAVLGARTQGELHRMLPPGAIAAGPVDTTALVTPGVFRQCLEQVAADESVDTVLAVLTPAASAELVPAACAADPGKPLALAVAGQSEVVRLLPGIAGRPRAVPAYACPEDAARVLAHAVQYGAWRARPPGHIPEFGDLRCDDAREHIRAFLARTPYGGWLPWSRAADLLACYGVEMVPADQATTIEHRTELVVGVVQEPVFGPLMIISVGGAPTTEPGDHAARLNPLTYADADELIRSVSTAPLLFGRCGGPAADTGALAGMLLRISRLVDDLPELAELEINPVIAAPGGAFAVGGRLRVTRAPATDPFLRQLR